MTVCAGSQSGIGSVGQGRAASPLGYPKALERKAPELMIFSHRLKIVNKDADPVTLVKDIHYTVSYQKNRDKGTATIIFTGLESGGYTGTKKTTFKITASDKKEGENQIEFIRITYKDAENVRDGIYVAPYMKGGAKPEVIVTSGGRTLASGMDYTISYANNKKIALSTDKKAPTITVKGKGNYSGSKKYASQLL